MYNFKAQLHGTGSRSIVVGSIRKILASYSILKWQQDAGIEARTRLRSSTESMSTSMSYIPQAECVPGYFKLLALIDLID